MVAVQEPRRPLPSAPTPSIGQPARLDAHQFRGLAGAVCGGTQCGGIGVERTQVQPLLGAVGVAQSAAGQAACIDARLQFVEGGLAVMEPRPRVRGTGHHPIPAPAVSSDSV